MDYYVARAPVKLFYTYTTTVDTRAVQAGHHCSTTYIKININIAL